MTNKFKAGIVMVFLGIVMLTVLSMLKFLPTQEITKVGTDKTGRCVEITYQVPMYLLDENQTNTDEVIKDRNLEPSFIAPCLINETGRMA